MYAMNCYIEIEHKIIQRSRIHSSWVTEAVYRFEKQLSSSLSSVLAPIPLSEPCYRWSNILKVHPCYHCQEPTSPTGVAESQRAQPSPAGSEVAVPGSNPRYLQDAADGAGQCLHQL